jgi:hypothetical protein
MTPFRRASVRFLAAAAVTAAIVSLIVASGEYWPHPLNIAGSALVLLAWAVALRLRVLAGASIGLLIWALTPELHAPDIPRAVVYIMIGAIVGAISEIRD